MKAHGILLTALASSLVFSGPVMAVKPVEMPIRNWQAPPYYQLPAGMEVQQAPAEAARAEVRDGEAGLAPTSTRGSSGEARQGLSARTPLIAGPPPTQLVFVAVAPCRVADTRSGSGFTGAYGPPSIGGSVSRDFTITGQCGIPAGAQAVSFNFTVWNTLSYGDFNIYPKGGTRPTVSTLNWGPGVLALANAAVVPLGTGANAGQITVVNESLSTVDLFFDVNGYYTTMSTPYFAGGENSGPLTSGNGFVYNATNLNIGSSTKCLVTSQVLISSSNTVSIGLVYNAWRVNGSVTNNSGPNWCFLSAPSAGNYWECSVTAVLVPTGSLTNSYDFGCDINAGGNATGGWCHTTVLCLP